MGGAEDGLDNRDVDGTASISLDEDESILSGVASSNI